MCFRPYNTGSLTRSASSDAPIYFERSADYRPRHWIATKPRLTTRCHFDRSVKSDNMYVTDGWTSPTGTRSLSPWANRSLSFMKSGLTP